MLRLGQLDRVVAIDRDAGTVTVEAGIPLWQLNDELAERGLALANLGDIDRQTISGAIATATHGGGEALRGPGDVRHARSSSSPPTARCCAVRRDEEPEVFACARVGLGALGVVTKVTLQCEPAFRLHSVEKPRSLDSLVDDLDDIVDHNEHIDCYWFPHTDVATVKVANRTDEPLRTKSPYKTWRDEILLANFAFGAAGRGRTTTPGCGPDAHEPRRRRDRQDRGRRREPQRALQPAARAFRRDGVRDPARTSSARRCCACATSSRARACRSTSRSSSGWPRPTTSRSARRTGRETGYLAVHLSAGTPFEPYFRGVEAIMDDFGGRPHWGKMHFQTAATLAPRYPEWDAVPGRPRAASTPTGGSATPYLDRVLGRRSTSP